MKVYLFDILRRILENAGNNYEINTSSTILELQCAGDFYSGKEIMLSERNKYDDYSWIGNIYT